MSRPCILFYTLSAVRVVATVRTKNSMFMWLLDSLSNCTSIVHDVQ